MEQPNRQPLAEPRFTAETAPFSPITWVIIDKPRNIERGGDDYFLCRSGIIEENHAHVMCVADGGPAEQLTSEESASHHQARTFSEKLSEALLTGESMKKACSQADRTINHTDRNFALAGTRIIYPVTKKDNFSIEAINYHDCYLAALIPTRENGKVVYKPKVYPLSSEISVTSDSLPPGTILLAGSDGSFLPLSNYVMAEYLEASSNEGYLNGPNYELYSQNMDRLMELQDKFDNSQPPKVYLDDVEAIRETLEMLLSLKQPQRGHEALFINELRQGISDKLFADDLTLLIGLLPTKGYEAELPTKISPAGTDFRPFEEVTTRPDYLTSEILSRHKELTRIYLSLQFHVNNTELDPSRTSTHRRQKLTRALRDFSANEQRELARSPLSLRAIKKLIEDMHEQKVLILDMNTDMNTYDNLRDLQVKSPLIKIALMAAVHVAIEDIEEKARASRAPSDYLWSLGIPHDLAKQISATDLERSLPVLDYFLKLYDPTTDNVRIEEIFSSKLAAEYIKRLLAQNHIESRLFANVASLVRFNDLDEKSKEWFSSRGIVLLDQSIQVHQRHKDKDEGGVPCHEVGWMILGVQEHDSVLVLPNAFKQDSFSTYYPGKKYSRGILAEVNYLDRWRLVLSRGFLAGTHTEARGIIVPFYPGGILYMGTENSFKDGATQNFYVRQTGANEIANLGFSRIFEYLTFKR